MVLVDTHSHIFAEEFDSDRKAVLERAAEVGVLYHILPNIDSSTTERMLCVAEEFTNCYPLMGLHPTSVKGNFEREIYHVEEYLAKQKFWGIGEIGIDLYWDKTFLPQQQEAFRYQLQLAKKYNLPVVIHARNSFNEIFEIVDQEIDDNLSGVFHSFSGSLDQYRHIEEYKSFFIGIGGIVTYKNGGLSDIVPHINTEKLLLETDSPYLSPVPVRGKRNESYNLIYIAQKISEILSIDVEKLAAQTTLNAQKLFKIDVK
ncbi:MAG: TatD DNase family protein [Tenuifilum sp.]|jgi:TatD DNase family protein|uniref:TatD family hydrolase n=1 Tax=Tenuifilum sp. TaxID=2760880 RepID=UPI0024AC34E6|nr:TatD family hydrolase [Tenuifilum sp.]MDI3525987.1 TatD DNase family protein [Tenuifilum sp.]